MNNLSWRTILLLLVVSSAFFWLGNWKTSFYDRDEPRFAQPAKEMLFAQSWKDWVVPHFNGEAFFHKPPLSYWQIAAAYKIFGVSEFSARFFSGLWTSLTAVLIAVFLTKRFSAFAGLAAAGAFCTSVLVIVEAKLATADASLGLLGILAVFAIWDMYRAAATFRTRLILWLAVGLAILCKGPTIFVLLVGLTGALLVLDRQRKWILQSGFWWGLPLALAIGLPWYVLSEQLSGGAMSGRFWQYDILQRISRPLESHRGFPGYYALTALINLWPWSAFLTPLAAFAWRNRSDRQIKFLLAWLIGPTLLLEFVATKMVHYWLIVLPAGIILLGLAFDAWQKDPEFWKRWSRPVLGTVCGVWVLMAGVVLAGQKIIFGQFIPPLFILGGILLVAAVLILFALRKKDLSLSFFTITFTMVLIVATLSSIVLPGLEPFKVSRQAARLMSSLGTSQTTYVLLGWQEPSTVFYLNPGNRPLIIESGDKFSSLIKQPDTVIGIADKAFPEISKAHPEVEFYGIDGFNYTRRNWPWTIYVARSGSNSTR
jgi:4-amino-4-deoxy-L-arabinose transferase-like glycosyltransferase